MILTDKQIVGKAGEDIACAKLEMAGFSVMQRNYLKKSGEIDIIAVKQNVIHFIEVKTNSVRNLKEVSQVNNNDYYDPIDNVHPKKMERFHKTIEVYLAENNINEEQDFVVDVVLVYLNLKDKEYKYVLYEDVY